MIGYLKIDNAKIKESLKIERNLIKETLNSVKSIRIQKIDKKGNKVKTKRINFRKILRVRERWTEFVRKV